MFLLAAIVMNGVGGNQHYFLRGEIFQRIDNIYERKIRNRKIEKLEIEKLKN